MTDTNRVTLSYAAESTYGTAPGSAAKTMRITGESIHQETSTITSSEIRADRQVADVVRSNLSVSGDTSIELSYSYDDLFQSALMSAAWSTEVIETAATNAVGSGGTTVFTEAGADGFDSFAVGQWVQVVDSSVAANNGFYKISAVGSTTVTVYGELAASSGSSATVTMGSQILNGSTQSSYTLERIYNDITAGQSGRCAQYTGCMIDGMTLNATTEAVVTGGFTWLGAKGSSLTTESDTSPDAASGKDVMNAIDDVNGVMEGSTYGSQTITAFSMALANNLRPRLQIGTLGAVSIGTGTCNVSGTFQRYYSDSTMIDKYLNFSDSSLAIIFEDVDGNAYCLDFPKIIYTSAQRVAGGQNQDLIADMSWEAVRDDTEDITIRISKWSA
jgi:hypothetical protein